ncbi:MAG: SMP-30/gluconolactonase/LRE family protein [Armatimonadota bacterium]
MENALFVVCLGAAMCLLTVSSGAAQQGSLEKVCGDLKFPEGPAWDGKGTLYFSNCSVDTISRLGPDGAFTFEWMKGSESPEKSPFRKTNGITVHRDGSLFICDYGLNAIVRVDPQTKKGEVYADRCDGEPFKGPNDLAFDPAGNLYFTDPVGSGRDNPVGCVYRVEAGTRKVTRVATGMAFPNGLAFTADGGYLYVCESQQNRIVRFPVKRDGSLGKMEPFADLSPNGPGEPDGMAVDSLGRLWVTHFGAHSVLIIEPDGRIVHRIEVPHTEGNGYGPTNIEFAGPDLRTVYITDPGSAALFRMRSEVPGLPLFCSPMDRRGTQ